MSGTSLNRTSVGLKLVNGSRTISSLHSLNRTSVGLKLDVAREEGWADGLPQSNQRGIETVCLGLMTQRMVVASIEPAWD